MMHTSDGRPIFSDPEVERRFYEKHWARAIELARTLDMVAGSDEIEAGSLMADLIAHAVRDPAELPMVLKLVMDADSQRLAPRTRH